MSQVQVKVPQLSESVSEATLLDWKFSEGSYVHADDVLVEVETDKVVLEIPAPEDGEIVALRALPGATVLAGEVIAVIETRKGESSGPNQEGKSSQKALSKSQTVVLMPSAEKALAERGVDIKEFMMSAPPGRLGREQVETILTSAPFAEHSAAASFSVAEPSVHVPPPELTLNARAAGQRTLTGDGVYTPDSSGRPEERVPMSRLRQRVADRLLASQREAAILTTFNEVDMSAVIALRNRYKERFEKAHGIKLGFMSFFVKAVVHALQQFPILNASIDGSNIIYHGYIDVGVAVSSDRGLVVPVIRNAQTLSFAEIEKAIADFASRAREGKLSMQDLSGGTFTVSNGGVFGSLFSTPIINPPQSAILGIHATKERPVAINGEVHVRPMNYFALSYDHRLIDGRDAVLGLAAIKAALEEPESLLFDL